jgi:hypothetical protein
MKPYVITSADFGAGSVTNKATAHGANLNSNEAQATVTNVFVKLTVTKTPDQAGDTGYLKHSGDIARFTINVKNDGVFTANNVSLNDPLPRNGEGFPTDPNASLNLSWQVESVTQTPASNPATVSCSIDNTSMTLTCGPVAPATALALPGGASFTVVVKATIPAGFLVPPPGAAGANSPFENDGNVVRNNATKEDWETAGINCASTTGCALDKPVGATDNSFGQGTSEDTPVPTVVAGSIPPNKSDLTRFYAKHARVSTTDFLYLAWERANAPSGSTNMDFELNKSSIISSNGITPTRSAGDLLISFDLAKGGTTPVIGYRKWLLVATAPGKTPRLDCEAASSYPCWSKGKTLASPIGVGSVNAAAITDPIPGADRPSPASLDPLTFGEALIDLQGAEIFPTTSGGDPSKCVSFGSAYLKSRSSASFTAEMKDFIAPLPVVVSDCAKTLANTASATATGLTPASDNGHILVDVVSPDGPSIISLSAPSGGVGTQITITGVNFGSSRGSSTVTFNGTAAAVADYVSWSATSIVVRVPAGATTGPVVVTLAGSPPIESNGIMFTVP